MTEQKHKVTSEIRVASFFAGAGGLDLGFHQPPFKLVYATDLESDCCKTLELNRGFVVDEDAQIVEGDIRDIPLTDLPSGIDIVVGGPPCQSFSASGRRAGGAAGRLDDRGNLFESYRDIIAHLSPKLFLFENVRGILATNRGEDWEHILSAFREIGFKLDYRILDAADYGVPQHRERIFLVGHKLKSNFLFPRPIFGPDSLTKRPHRSPAELFANLQIDEREQSQLRFEGGKYSHLLPEVPPGQNYLYFTAKRGHPKPAFAYRSRFSDFLYKAHPDYPMKTIIASPGKYTGPLHWESRYFSIPEYKTIQGFPQEYKFFGDRASVIKQIGNSVSPAIAISLAQAIANQVSNCEYDVDYLSPDESLSFDKRKGVKAAKTRDLHAGVESANKNRFKFKRGYQPFEFFTQPSDFEGESNTYCSCDKKRHLIRIVDTSEIGATTAAKILIAFWPLPRVFSGKREANLEVELIGSGPKSPQLIWNAVDEWTRRVSTFQSLFELYGHFTEPYPYFSVESFDVFVDNPWLRFAKAVSDQSKCSRYLDKSELVDQFRSVSRTTDFDALARDLRSIRFDVRTRETNIAIPAGKYMMAYPFTLPESKQMNFTLRTPTTDRVAGSYITEKRVMA